MTDTQVKYWDYKEGQRHNLVTEGQSERKLASDIQVNQANVGFTQMRTKLTASEIGLTKQKTKTEKQNTKLVKEKTKTQKQETKLTKEKAKTQKQETKLTKEKVKTQKVTTDKVKAETAKTLTDAKLSAAKIATELAKGKLTRKQIENYTLDQLNHSNSVGKGIAMVGYLAQLATDPSQSSSVKQWAAKQVAALAQDNSRSDSKSKGKSKSVPQIVSNNNGTTWAIRDGDKIYASAKSIMDWFRKNIGTPPPI